MFDPNPNEMLALGGQNYTVVAHSAYTDVAAAVTGARATVFVLQRHNTEDHYALKVLHEGDRGPEILRNQALLRQLAPIPGFGACRQVYFTRQTHADELDRYPDLEYGSLMPWIKGWTWRMILESSKVVDLATSYSLAHDMVSQVALLERHGIAHGDLSGSNVLIDLKEGTVNLIDFDDAFWPGAAHPKWTVTGTRGYYKDEALHFKASADRFATAVLVTEFLICSNPEHRAAAATPTYFSDDDIAAPGSERYVRTRDFLQGFDRGVAALFERAWAAPVSDQCPTIAEWEETLLTAHAWVTEASRVRATVRLDIAPRAGVAARPHQAPGATAPAGIPLFAVTTENAGTETQDLKREGKRRTLMDGVGQIGGPVAPAKQIRAERGQRFWRRATLFVVGSIVGTMAVLALLLIVVLRIMALIGA